MLVLLVLAGLGSMPAAHAQTAPPVETRYTFALVGVPLSEALERLVEETSISLVYETPLVAGRTAFCKAERVPAEALLKCILHDTGLDFVRLSSGTYVLIRTPRAAPRYGRLTGQVLDADTGMPLADASVLLAGENTGTATNRDGRFAFAALRPGRHRVVVTHVAYHATADTVYVGPEAGGRLEVSMVPRVVLTAPVVVSGFEIRLPAAGLGTDALDAEAIGAPAGLGSEDVVQSLDAVVGVRLGEALSDVHVQGGAIDEQLFLLDGVPVFVPVPNGGFVGPFSPLAAAHVTVRKAGYGAAHGSGLSGVIDVTQRLAARDGPAFTIQLDPLSLNARWAARAGRPERTEAAWMIAARRALWGFYEPARLETLFKRWATPDAFLSEVLGSSSEDPIEATPPAGLEVGFGDLHAAGRLRFGGLRSLYGSFYGGSNVFGIDDVAPAGPGAPEDVFERAYRWSNRAGQLRYEWVQSRRLFLHAGAWNTSYTLRHPASRALGDAPTLASHEFNELAETGVRIGGDWAVSARHALSGAAEASHTESDFFLSLDPFGAAPAGPAMLRPVAWRVAGYVEDRWALSHRTTLTLGTRLTYLPEQQTLYAEPRLAAQHEGTAGARGTWAVRGAVGLYRQYLHAFDVATYNVSALLPRVRFWLPVGRDQRPPEAYHAAAAIRYRPAPGWQLGAEAYYKHQPHLLVLDYGRDPQAPAADVLADVLADAYGYAYGVAASAARQGRRLQLGVHYEYAVARRRVANRFGGAFVPVPWEAPHRLYLALDVLPHPQWTATVRWQGVFGRRWAFRQAYYDFLEPSAPTRLFGAFDLSDPAAHRLPAFAQWDAGLAYARRVAGVGVQARLAFINLLGRRNITDWSLRAEGGRYVREGRPAASFIPSASVRVSL